MKYLLMAALVCMTAAGAQPIKYTSSHDSWNADSLGAHRALIHVAGAGKVARVVIPWRRHDAHPGEKRIIVQDAKTRKNINNLRTGRVNNESGELWFEPASGPGDYYVYYMPYKNEGSHNYPKDVYLKPGQTADARWLAAVDKAIPATVKELQSVNDFNSFYPMELAATEEETLGLVRESANPAYLVFPEDRLHPVKMPYHIPYRWVQKGLLHSFTDTAARGEAFTFQLGIYAQKTMRNVRVAFTDLVSGPAKIKGENITCFNTDGIGYDGRPIKYEVAVSSGRVQSLWCGIEVPKNTAAGRYSGKATVTADGLPATVIDINLYVTDKTLADGGISEPRKQTRLHWLNSTLAQENTVIAPYTSLLLEGDSAVRFLGRRLTISKDGFPKQIQTFFTKEMTGYQPIPNNLLYEPIHFHFTKQSDGKDVKLINGPVQFTEKSAGTVQWRCSSTTDSLQMEVEALLEFDGFMRYTVKVTALNDMDFKDIVMHIPFQKDKADYLMGLGQKGGRRPEKVAWKWDVAHKNQDGAWVGAVNSGLQYTLRDEKYVRPLNTNFYLQKPLVLPASWDNGGKGGIEVGIKGSSMLANNYSGPRHMKKGDTVYYNFTLLITPFHPINTDFQWATRFYHRYENPDTVKATGATVVNIHHGTPVNPYINYPFIAYKELKAYIDKAHRKGLKVKIYNTVRELSDRAYELYPLRSLGHEIFSPGAGGGPAWLQEHLDTDYIAAWAVPEVKDAAIVNSGASRWHNYYVEGMNWLVKNAGIDGIYLDDVAFDRITMKRIKRVLTAGGHPGIIDLHSANQYNKADGFHNSANLYMEHFPYLDRLWFGEYFDYKNEGPDFFLTEVSGIPFGLMGEMLQGGGNPWRGMIYGMTNRLPWSDSADPRPIWRAWDDFGMQGSEMIGYWSDNCPVKTDNAQVPATVYKRKGSALIAIASWAAADADINLLIDWKKLGVDSSKATITAPVINGFQEAVATEAGQPLKIPKGRGLLLIIRQKP